MFGTIKLDGFNPHSFRALQGLTKQSLGKAAPLELEPGQDHSNPCQSPAIAQQSRSRRQLPVDLDGKTSFRSEFEQRAPVFFRLIPTCLRRQVEGRRNIFGSHGPQRFLLSHSRIPWQTASQNAARR